MILMSFAIFYTCWCLASSKMRDAGKTFVAMLVLSVCVLGNFVFHSGEVPLLIRYGYMEQLFILMLFFVALFPLRQTLLDAWDSNAVFRRNALRWSYALGLVCAVSILSLMAINVFRVRRTLEFDEFLTRLKPYENAQIINLSQPISSLEQYYSLRRFAEAKRAPKIYYFPVYAVPEDAFQKSLQDNLKQESAADPAPALTQGAALAEFSNNGWFRIIEHTSPHRDIEQTVLIDGWRENITTLDKILGRTTAEKGRRSSGDKMSLALPVDKVQPYSVVVNAVPFDAEPDESEAVFFFNDVEVKRAKLKDYREDFHFEVPLEVAQKSPLHENLMKLETRIENASPTKHNELTFYSIDISPLP
ncbi:hypothetical protein AGMMS50276_15980 [Synergistales bacterium]|nr:hypothetical protein AGMMS50276_15980 [Synergistales bacterium]